MIGIVTIFDETDTLVEMFQLEISNNNKKKYSELMTEIHSGESELRKHIGTELVKKYPENIYWICNIFSDFMNYLYCIDNDN